MGPRSRAIGLLEQAGAPNKVQTGLFEDHKAPGALAFGAPFQEQMGPKSTPYHMGPPGARWAPDQVSLGS